MASFFRRKVAQKILSVIQATTNERLAVNSIAPLVKVSQKRAQQPQLLLPIRSLFKVLPSVNSEVVPENLLLTMRNQGLPTAEGFTDIELIEAPQSLVFTVDKHVFSRIVLLDICVELSNISKSSCLLNSISQKNIIVNFSLPTIGKNMTFEQLRALMHGNFIANLCEFLKLNVSRINSVEDWGPNCGLLVAGYNCFGHAEELERNPTSHLSEVLKASLVKYNGDETFRQKVSDCLEKMEEGDTSLLSLKDKLQTLWLKEMKHIYMRLGIIVDDFEYDSISQKRIKAVSDELLQEGTIAFDRLTAELNIGEMEAPIKLRENISGLTAYSFARIISSAISKKEYTGFDDLYFVAEKSQSEYYNWIFKLLDQKGYSWSRDLHFVSFRKIEYFDGQKGSPDSVQQILDKAKTCILRELKMDISLELGDNADDIAENLAVAALIINDMKHKRSRGYSFNWDEVLLFGGDSGISYQFYHAALQKLQEESEIKFNFDIDLSPLSEQIALQLVQHLARFDEVIFRAYKYMEPYVLLEYIQTLCYLTGKATDILKLDIKECRLRVIKARLMLFHATQKVLNQSLKTLGIQPLENV